MKRTATIFTITLAAGCASFNPDLNGLDGGETGTGTSGETDGDSGETDGDSATSTSGPDTGDETGSTGDGTPLCGDNVAEGDEECDGTDLAGTVCEDGEFYGGGSTGCTMDCALDFSACEDLFYEQNFETDQMPNEVLEVGGVAPPFIVKGSDLYNYQGQYNGSCFHGDDDFCMQAGAITHGQVSGFRFGLDFAAPGEVRSWVSGWTEEFDVLQVQLDYQVECEYSQNFLAWEECVIAVDTAGYHMLSWVYSKNGSISEGIDTVWVDSITATNAELP